MLLLLAGGNAKQVWDYSYIADENRSDFHITMKKGAIAIGFIAAFLFLLLAVARVSGLVGYYKVVSPGNDPTLKVGDVFFTSALTKPKHKDFICFKGTMPGSTQEAIYCFRLFGMEGDEVEIKNGFCYVNGQFADSGINLAHAFIIADDDLEGIQRQVIDVEPAYAPSPDSLIVNLPDRAVTDHNLPATRFIAPFVPGVFNPNNKHWSINFFGPVKVPQGKYFVLGDNRDNAYDSRYIGFIDNGNFKGTVVYP